MKIAFTICSNNYLAQAKTLANSFTYHNPDYKFYIIIVDKLLEKKNYEIKEGIEVLPINSIIGEIKLQELISKYNIVELNTAVKASCFKYLKSKHSDLQFIYYLDPDIMVFNSFEELDKRFKKNDILLTPHVLSPKITYEKNDLETTLLWTGVYNLGFLGLKANSSDVDNLLDWWEDRLFKIGFIEPFHNLFVDQKWADFIPSYFENVDIIRELGCNMAPWNIHERFITESNTESIIINKKDKLYFYHFSNYKYQNKEQICKLYQSETFTTRPDLKCIYTDYYDKLLSNNVEFYSKQICQLNILKKKTLLIRILRKINTMWYPIPY